MPLNIQSLPVSAGRLHTNTLTFDRFSLDAAQALLGGKRFTDPSSCLDSLKPQPLLDQVLGIEADALDFRWRADRNTFARAILPPRWKCSWRPDAPRDLSRIFLTGHRQTAWRRRQSMRREGT